ncbi:type II secretion system protein [Gemmiger sp.]
MSLLNLLEEFVMFEKIRKMKNKKGFTLVELIVVLVILAILAALLVPALTGYIDRARKEAIVAETRSCVMAAQTIAAEKYGANAADVAAADMMAAVDDIKELAEVDGDVSAITMKKAAGSDYAGKVSTLTYTKGAWTCTYTEGVTTGSNGAYDVQPKT